MSIEINIPENVKVDLNGTEVETKGSLGSNKRKFNDALLKVHKSDSKIVIEPVKDKTLAKKAETSEKSFRKELENDIKGVNNYFEKKMKIVFAHFPINVAVKGDKLLINNIIGERVPRVCSIMGNTKIDVAGQNVRIYGTSLDDVAQTAANIRLACRIRNKDSRVFQDGLYYEIE